MRRLLTAGMVAGALALAPGVAQAFCGFYVAGADAKLFNNATLVVMLRDGARTVLSMQNNYQGPPDDFAMVVPVPVVLQKENVKTLPRDIFDKVDKLAAPRLVEYWEEDPCAPEVRYEKMAMPMSASVGAMGGSGGTGDRGVKIEAQFTVAEYEIVILSAKDSGGLEAWLKEQKYKIPDGAEPLLRPYVAAGSKFFVAKVDAQKVTFKDGQAMLSPLRFHYDTDTFTLPVRLGLVNSAGAQDLLVHILARGKRYEVANMPNVTIPTNLDVKDPTKEAFAPFYTALFDATLEKHKGAVVTEYAWDASSCDPCPIPALDQGELATLGTDTLSQERSNPWGWTLTRLHARYGKDTLGEDLVFREANAITGGREFLQEAGQLEQGARPAPGGSNNFQARYAIRHPWEGKITCDKPIRGRWGGPPGGGTPQPRPATDLAFAKRGQPVGAFLAKDLPELGIKAGGSVVDTATQPPEPKASTDKPADKPADKPSKAPGGCGCGVAVGLAFAFAGTRKKRAS